MEAQEPKLAAQLLSSDQSLDLAFFLDSKVTRDIGQT